MYFFVCSFSPFPVSKSALGRQRSYLGFLTMPMTVLTVVDTPKIVTDLWLRILHFLPLDEWRGHSACYCPNSHSDGTDLKPHASIAKNHLNTTNRPPETLRVEWWIQPYELSVKRYPHSLEFRLVLLHLSGYKVDVSRYWLRV